LREELDSGIDEMGLSLKSVADFWQDISLRRSVEIDDIGKTEAAADREIPLLSRNMSLLSVTAEDSR
jgi:hypothetical protein